MKRKENIIDKISLRMMNDEISDEAIITLISENVGDLEMGDRQGRTLLIDAAFYKRQKVMEWLLAHGANINAQDENGFSALHAATQEKNIKMVSFLLQNGAHVNIQDAFGNTPISRTNLATPIELFRMLLEAGANPRTLGTAWLLGKPLMCRPAFLPLASDTLLRFKTLHYANVLMAYTMMPSASSSG